MLRPKKNHTRNLITKKNSCGSKIRQPSPRPPINFLMVRPQTVAIVAGESSVVGSETVRETSGWQGKLITKRHNCILDFIRPLISGNFGRLLRVVFTPSG